MSLQNVLAASAKKNIRGDANFDQKTFQIGENIYVRTVTYAAIGKVIGFSQLGPCVFVHLDNAFYVANSDRFFDGFVKGTVKEGEPVPGIMRVHVNSFVDICEWNHKVPDKQI